MLRRPLLLLLLLCASAPAAAQDALIYNRSDLYIESKREKLPWLSQKKPDAAKTAEDAKDTEKKSKKPEMETVRYKFAVEIRPYDSTRLDWFQTLGGIKPAHGVLLTLKPTKSPAIDWSKLLVKVDLLYIRENGVIDTILPDISGAEMTEEPTANAPITALLYLKAGTVDAYKLRPGNKVIQQIFNPSPRVLQ